MAVHSLYQLISHIKPVFDGPVKHVAVGPLRQHTLQTIHAARTNNPSKSVAY